MHGLFVREEKKEMGDTVECCGQIVYKLWIMWKKLWIMCMLLWKSIERMR